MRNRSLLGILAGAAAFGALASPALAFGIDDVWQNGSAAREESFSTSFPSGTDRYSRYYRAPAAYGYAPYGYAAPYPYYRRFR